MFKLKYCQNLLAECVLECAFNVSNMLANVHVFVDLTSVVLADCYMNIHCLNPMNKFTEIQMAQNAKKNTT